MPPVQTDRRRVSLAFAAAPLGLLFGSRGLAAQTIEPVDLFEPVETIRARQGIPALGAALATSDGLVAVGVAGVRAFPDGPLVTVGDRWHIGSCTKAMTATLAARLVEAGLLWWDSTIGEVLGGDMHAGWRDVSLIALLCHRSGAEGNFDQSLWEAMVARGGSLREQRAFFAAEGLKTPPAFEPGIRSSYSNAGFMVAGAMMERAADLDWESLIRREVFEPLGMTSAGFGAPGTPGLLDEPLGHVRGADGAWRRVDLGPGDDNPAAAGPAGTVHVSLPDWARFIAAHLKGSGGDGAYLSHASWLRLHTPGGPGWDYAPGWSIAGSGEGPSMLTHLGSNGHFVAQATIWPDRDRGALLVTNLADDAAEPAFRDLQSQLEGLGVDG